MSVIPQAKAQLRDLCAELWPDAAANLGAPSLDLPWEIVVVSDASANLDKPTAGGPRRSREETAEITVIISVFRPDDTDDAQAECSARAWAMTEQLDTHLRERGNETLDGLCREAWVSAYKSADYRLDADSLVAGRATDVTVTITAAARI